MQGSVTTQLMLSLEPLKQRHFACVCVCFFLHNSELKENKKNLEKKKKKKKRKKEEENIVVPFPVCKS